MKILIVIGIGLMFGNMAFTQEPSQYSFSLLRQYDNIDAFKNQDKKSFYNSFKYLKINEDAFVSFGGSWRFQSESYINEQFQNVENQDNLWFLNRVLLHAHLKIRDNFEVFAELNSSTVQGKEAISPADKDVLSVNQLFAKYHFNQNWSIGTGRENMSFGTKRLVGPREGPNVRRSFDKAEINYNSNRFVAKAFYAIPVQQKPKVFDNEYLKFDETFSGLYTTTRFNKATHFDIYTFYQKDDNVTYSVGTANERRASVGARYFGKYNTFTYDSEIVYQFGNFGNQDIQAWTISLQLEKSMHILNKDFNLGVKSEIISGDKNPDDQTLNTFDALYPRGAYFGRIARFGPSNLIDVHPYINAQFKKLSVELDYDIFWRYSVNDGVYNAALLLEYPNTNNKKFIGHQIGTIFGYQLNNHISLEFESNIIYPGSFLKQSNQGNTLYHFVFTSEIRF